MSAAKGFLAATTCKRKCPTGCIGISSISLTREKRRGENHGWSNRKILGKRFADRDSQLRIFADRFCSACAGRERRAVLGRSQGPGEERPGRAAGRHGCATDLG